MNTAQIQWARTRIRSEAIVNGKYELDVQRETNMGNLLFIPGLTSPVAEIRQLLFGQGQPGGSWIPTLSSAMIAANTFGSGVEDILDLSGNNNPFSQATSGSRAAWFREPKTGRRNQHIHTENFSNAVWTKSDVTVGADQSGPLPGMVAQKITKNNGVNGVIFGGGSTGLVSSGQTWTVSVFAKAAEFTFIKVCHAAAAFGGSNVGVTVNLATGAIVATDAPITPTVVELPNGWYRISATATSTGTAKGDLTVFFGSTSSVSDLGNGTNGILLSGSMQDQSATLRPYQRVTTAFDVTEAGQRDCYGVRFDGTDDWYERAINFSGTDKVTLFVAMRRRSDAARGTVLELTSSIDSNNGAFHLTAPNAASATFGFESKGTTLRDAVITQAMGNPRIITAIGDIAGDLASIQVDNGTPTTNTGDQGSGNYANSTLYLGRRGGSSLSLNGDIFGVIAAGGEYTAATRQRVRTILSRTTPTVNL